MESDKPTSGKEQLIATFGEPAVRLHALVSGVHPSLGNHLITSALGGPFSPNTDLRGRQSVRLAVLATQGSAGDDLTVEVNMAIDVGVSPAEVVEVIIHTIPYAGIPRPLNTLLATKAVLDQRNLLPVQLEEPEWSDGERESVGKDMIARAHPIASPALKANLADIAPSVYEYIVAAAFGDIYGRPGLSCEQRQPATIASLAAQAGVQNHLATHVNGALNIELEPEVILRTLIEIVPLVETERILESVQTALGVFSERGVLVTSLGIEPGNAS